MSAAETVAVRFASEPDAGFARAVPVERVAAPAEDTRLLADLMFDASPFAQPAAPRRPESSAATNAAPPAAAETTGTVPARPVKRAVARAVQTLFNDAQIASIKARLRLSALQEQYWPAVEKALREIAWRHTRDRAGSKPTLDPAEVQRLKYAALPLVMNLRQDQKQELMRLAQIMGLEKVAAQF